MALFFTFLLSNRLSIRLDFLTIDFQPCLYCTLKFNLLFQLSWDSLKDRNAGLTGMSKIRFQDRVGVRVRVIIELVLKFEAI